MAHQMQTSMEMERAINDSLDCYRACSQTISHCLEMGGKHVEPGHIRLLMDCENICALSALYMARGSQFHPEVCGICADICDRCAQSCLEVDPNDSMMQQCADACRTCAQSCRVMARMRRAA